MKTGQIKNNQLDRLISNALTFDDNLIVPPHLAEMTIRKLEKKALLKELLLELSLKVGLVLGSLAVFAGIFAWINGSSVFTSLTKFFVNNRQVIISLLLISIIVIFIDQIVLKFYAQFREKESLKA
jgi:hypothetical protein